MQTDEIIASPEPQKAPLALGKPSSCPGTWQGNSSSVPIQAVYLLTATAALRAIKGRAEAGYTAWMLKSVLFLISTSQKSQGFCVHFGFYRLGAFLWPSPASFAHRNRSLCSDQTSRGTNSITWSIKQPGKCCTADASWLLKLLRCDTGHHQEHTSFIKSPISPGWGITGLIGYCGSAPIGLSSTLLTPGALFST